MTALVPLSLLAPLNDSNARLFFRLSLVGTFGLFPLFSHVRELPTKCLLYLSFMRLVYVLLFKSYEDHEVNTNEVNETKNNDRSRGTVGGDVSGGDVSGGGGVNWKQVSSTMVTKKLFLVDFMFIYTITFIGMLCEVGFPLYFHNKHSDGEQGEDVASHKYEFLPLMIMSVSCALGVCFCWVAMTWQLINSE